MDFQPDGRIIIVDNNNNKCVLFNQKLEQKDYFVLSFTPQDLVSVSENERAITSGKVSRIVFLCVGSRKLSMSREFVVKTKYSSICLMDEEQFIASTFDDLQLVKVVSMSGNENNLGVNFPSKRYRNGQSACSYFRHLINKLIQIEARDFLHLRPCYQHAHRS